MKFKLPRMIRVRRIGPTTEDFTEGKTYWMTHFDSDGFCEIKGKEASPHRCEWFLRHFEQLPRPTGKGKWHYQGESQDDFF